MAQVILVMPFLPKRFATHLASKRSNIVMDEQVVLDIRSLTKAFAAENASESILPGILAPIGLVSVTICRDVVAIELVHYVAYFG